MILGQQVFLVRQSLSGTKAYEFTVSKLDGDFSYVVRKICPLRKELLRVPNNLLSKDKNSAYSIKNSVINNPLITKI